MACVRGSSSGDGGVSCVCNGAGGMWWRMKKMRCVCRGDDAGGCMCAGVCGGEGT